MEGVQLSIFDEMLEHEDPVQASYIPEESALISVQSDSFGLSGLDLLSKFEALEIENSSLISDEDREFCEGMQKRLEEAVSLILKAKDFYETNSMSNIFLSTNNLIRDLDEQLSSRIDFLISKITHHFRSTYSVSIDSSKFRKYDHTIQYMDVVDDILLQMDGMNFKEKAHEEIKDGVRDTIYNSSKVKVKSVKVSIADYMYFEGWFGAGNFRNNRSDTLSKLLRGVELFESGSLTVRETLKSLTIDYIRNDWFRDFTFPCMDKLTSIRFYMNGKVELKFKDHELAMAFAREYLKYS